MSYQKIREIIERNDSIVIYRHIHPDYDAIGSQLGLYFLIKDNYPEKKVYSYGLQTIDNEPFVLKMDNPDESIIKDSLTISLDTSTTVRSDDTSFLLGKEKIKIDHHLDSEQVDDCYCLVEEKSCACCFIIAKMALELNWFISKRAASYLYAGIMTDTLSLKIESVSPETFEVVGKLVGCGVDIVKINRYIYDKSIDGFKASIYFGSKARFIEDVAYIYVSIEDREKLNVTASQAKDYVDLLSNIKGVNKYAVFAQEDDNSYSVSLRSHNATIVDIAVLYGGGGHRLASGIKSVSLCQTKEIIDLLIKAKE